MDEDLVTRTIELPGGALRLYQPRESAELPDAGGVEWAPVAPYWSVLWRSGVALARDLGQLDLAGLRVIELGCGLGLPSIVAARAGAEVLATDASPEALALLQRNASANGVALATAVFDWTEARSVPGASFDLALAADVLYEPGPAAAVLARLARLAPEVWLADPGRPQSARLLREQPGMAPIESRRRGVVLIHRLAIRRAAAHSRGSG